MWNPSVFNKDGIKNILDPEIIPRYCELSLKYEFCYEMMKYTILNMMRETQETDERGLKTRGALSSMEIAAAWGVYRKEDPVNKKRKIEQNPDDPYPYIHNHFKKQRFWPKCAIAKFMKVSKI
jgi:hypothetical protein